MACSSCGGSPILDFGEMKTMSKQVNDPVTPGFTRVQFTGPQAGGLTYTNPVTGNSYTGGNNSAERYTDVRKEDLDYILSRGVFKVVEVPAVETMTVAEKQAAGLDGNQSGAAITVNSDSNPAPTEGFNPDAFVTDPATGQNTVAPTAPATLSEEQTGQDEGKSSSKKTGSK